MTAVLVGLGILAWYGVLAFLFYEEVCKLAAGRSQAPPRSDGNDPAGGDTPRVRVLARSCHKESV